MFNQEEIEVQPEKYIGLTKRKKFSQEEIKVQSRDRSLDKNEYRFSQEIQVSQKDISSQEIEV